MIDLADDDTPPVVARLDGLLVAPEQGSVVAHPGSVWQ